MYELQLVDDIPTLDWISTGLSARIASFVDISLKGDQLQGEQIDIAHFSDLGNLINYYLFQVASEIATKVPLTLPLPTPLYALLCPILSKEISGVGYRFKVTFRPSFPNGITDITVINKIFGKGGILQKRLGGSILSGIDYLKDGKLIPYELYVGDSKTKKLKYLTVDPHKSCIAFLEGGTFSFFTGRTIAELHAASVLNLFPQTTLSVDTTSFDRVKAYASSSKFPKMAPLTNDVRTAGAAAVSLLFSAVGGRLPCIGGGVLVSMIHNGMLIDAAKASVMAACRKNPYSDMEGTFINPVNETGFAFTLMAFLAHRSPEKLMVHAGDFLSDNNAKTKFNQFIRYLANHATNVQVPTCLSESLHFNSSTLVVLDQKSYTMVYPIIGYEFDTVPQNISKRDPKYFMAFVRRILNDAVDTPSNPTTYNAVINGSSQCLTYITGMCMQSTGLHSSHLISVDSGAVQMGSHWMIERFYTLNNTYDPTKSTPPVLAQKDHGACFLVPSAVSAQAMLDRLPQGPPINAAYLKDVIGSNIYYDFLTIKVDGVNVPTLASVTADLQTVLSSGLDDHDQTLGIHLYGSLLDTHKIELIAAIARGSLLTFDQNTVQDPNAFGLVLKSTFPKDRSAIIAGSWQVPRTSSKHHNGLQHMAFWYANHGGWGNIGALFKKVLSHKDQLLDVGKGIYSAGKQIKDVFTAGHGLINTFKHG